MDMFDSTSVSKGLTKITNSVINLTICIIKDYYQHQQN